MKTHTWQVEVKDTRVYKIRVEAKTRDEAESKGQTYILNASENALLMLKEGDGVTSTAVCMTK